MHSPKGIGEGRQLWRLFLIGYGRYSANLSASGRRAQLQILRGRHASILSSHPRHVTTRHSVNYVVRNR